MIHMKAMLLALMLVATTASPTMAQSTQTPANGTEVAWYEIVSRDTLWTLLGPKWTELAGMNVWLTTEGRIKYNNANDVNVRIYPKEILQLNDELKALLEARGVKVIKVKAPTPILTPVPPPVNPGTEWTPTENSAGFDWLGLLQGIAIVTVLAAIAGFILRKLPEARRPNLPFLGSWNPSLTTNPVTAIPPMAPGGINPDSHQAIRTQLREQAARQYAMNHGGTMPAMENIRVVGDITRGTLHDVWETRDARGRWTARRFNGEPGYQAMVSINGNDPQLQTFCQICGNDLRFGTRYRNGRFVPDTQVRPIPATEPAPAPLRVVAANEGGSSATVVFGNKEFSVTNGTLRVTIDKKTGHITDFEANGHVRTNKVTAVQKSTTTRTGTTGA
jgi:hypothetical protein